MAHMTNPLATPDQIFHRNSLDSLPVELRDAIFLSTQCLTQAAGILLQFPQSVTAQANVLLARFWLIEPMMSHEFSDVSAATLYLTAKISPCPCTPRDLSNVYAYLLSPSSTFLSSPSNHPPKNIPRDYYQSETAYHAFHSRVLSLEHLILCSLSFDTTVSLPHPLAITYLQSMDFLHFPKEKITRRAVEYLNSALLSPQMLYLTTQPNGLAVAAIYNAAKDVGAKMPECEWWEVFDVDREDLGFLVVGMRSLEGWVESMRGDGVLGRRKGGGMITRKEVRAILGSDRPKEKEEDPELAMARRMDEKMKEIEGSAA
ncbi:cyclin-like protein [Apiosordaria backusii]|uniref:Cyclin-like protein n=1 Tax=Apiosordaria backusii TaxID=314023 RepID=A0AA39ZV70_9PEZI|nr:cyclin-like protein [Apiosordaria backusii]